MEKKKSPAKRLIPIEIELIATIVGLCLGAIVYGIMGFSYVHATFLTRTEADTMGKGRDRSEDSLEKKIDMIDGKVDKIYELLLNRK